MNSLLRPGIINSIATCAHPSRTIKITFCMQFQKHFFDNNCDVLIYIGVRLWLDPLGLFSCYESASSFHSFDCFSMMIHWARYEACIKAKQLMCLATAKSRAKDLASKIFLPLLRHVRPHTGRCGCYPI